MHVTFDTVKFMLAAEWQADFFVVVVQCLELLEDRHLKHIFILKLIMMAFTKY